MATSTTDGTSVDMVESICGAIVAVAQKLGPDYTFCVLLMLILVAGVVGFFYVWAVYVNEDGTLVALRNECEKSVHRAADEARTYKMLYFTRVGGMTPSEATDLFEKGGYLTAKESREAAEQSRPPQTHPDSKKEGT
ncbi:hypothetical protein [Rubripirellula lacrimiformis]|nr:hypothetical protein [Rubripirellula lacrimiformis]